VIKKGIMEAQEHRAKALESIRQQIAEARAKIVDPVTPQAEKEKLASKVQELLRSADQYSEK